MGSVISYEQIGLRMPLREARAQLRELLISGLQIAVGYLRFATVPLRSPY